MAECDNARPSTGYYMDLAWHDLLARTTIPTRRTWLAAWGTDKPAGATVWQDATNVSVKGIVGPVDTDVLLSSRGLNVPTSPPKRPTAATATRVTPQVDDADAVPDGPIPGDSEPEVPAQ
jgi:GH25 family lysozyme M1 (1,4-beta-N-acetylmuramidase)